MIAQEIRGDTYVIEFESETTTFYFKGELSLSGVSKYEPIISLLTEVVDTDPPILTFNFKELTFLNSSGINVLSKFVLGLRKKQGTQLVVLAAANMPWQGKSLKNLGRLLPSLQFKLEW